MSLSKLKLGIQFHLQSLKNNDINMLSKMDEIHKLTLKVEEYSIFLCSCVGRQFMF